MYLITSLQYVARNKENQQSLMISSLQKKRYDLSKEETVTQIEDNEIRWYEYCTILNELISYTW